MKPIYIWLFIILLASISAFLSQIALFVPTLPMMKGSTLTVQLILSMIFVLIQGFIVIPLLWKGLLIMSPVQLTIFVFVVTFIIQLVTNVYIFKNVNTIDDYIAVILITLGIVISKFRIFG